METLARFAGPLALLGGGAWIIAGLVQAVAPTAPSWIGVFAAILLIGGAAFGLQRHVGAGTGSLARWGATAAAVGSVVLVACALMVVATGQANAATPPPILVALALMSALLWFVGGLAFALGLLRAKAISPLAGWLVVLGAVIVPGLVVAIPQDPPPFVYVPLVLYGVGWMLVGYEAWRQRVGVGMAGHAG